MRLQYSAPQVLVFDDVLSPKEFRYVWAYVQTQDYEFVHAREWVKAWRPDDGEPLRGPVTLSHETMSDVLSPRFPTGLGVDLIMKTILRSLDQLEPWVGKHMEDWEYFFCRPYLYPNGSALSWHRDDQQNTTGAFTFYCHNEWNIQWGGELLVADLETKNFQFSETELYGEPSRFIGTQLENGQENDRLLEPGVGTYIFPKPNRLVFVPAGVMHAIKRVDQSAGRRVRATLQGTFMYPGKPEGS
jgi:hypothetical protein